MKKRLKKNDKVVILTGKSKNKTGEILELSWKHSRVKVKGVNLVTKHLKAAKQGDVSKITKQEAFIHISNVMPIDSMTGKPMRHNKNKNKNS
jgi:large subunit ribosomal protein L24